MKFHGRGNCMNEEMFTQLDYTDEELEKIDFEEKVANIISILVIVGFAVIMALGIFNEFIIF